MHLLGLDLSTLHNQLKALTLNLYAWARSYYAYPFKHRQLQASRPPVENDNSCIEIAAPGGFDQLQHISLPVQTLTVGYNVPPFKAPYAHVVSASEIAPDLAIIRVKYFSVNYADITIRWGLYESALRYVGWPIVPGFDFAGEVEHAHISSGFQVGDAVFGYTLFGAYSSRLLVPVTQVRRVPSNLSLQDAAGLPAVAATALHAISLCGAWPNSLLTRNKAALIHSAAGGVGSMLIQMCKIRGFSPIVAVVGSSHKVELCYSLGADKAIDKSSLTSTQLWSVIRSASPSGYASVFDANGVSTLQESYNCLSNCGRLVTYGFHTNVPRSVGLLSPLSWLSMIYRMLSLPRFDPMNLVLNSRAVLGFNLSFFADEHELIAAYMHQILEWVESGVVKVPAVTLFSMSEVSKAHELIQSGSSVGKVVIQL